MTELPGQTTTPGGLEIHDPEEVYQFRVQADQSFYAQGTISEIVSEAFRLGYERAKEDYRVDEQTALALKLTREWQQVIAWLAEDVMGSLETVKEVELNAPGHPFYHGKMSVLKHFREMADADERRFLGGEQPHV